MWDSKYTDYKITNTPYKKDIVKMLSDACSKRGMGFGIYYSLPDWHHPNYPNIGRHHELFWPEATKEIDEDKYLDYVKNQVRELCENYGEINQFFWDINVAEFYKPEINEMIRELQPSIIFNDRGPGPEDYTTPEREIPPGGAFKTPVMAVNSVGRESWEKFYDYPMIIRMDF
jgi:alpha-L-fucosidase